MIDPGDPFLSGHDFAALVGALQDDLLLGVEHDETHRFAFDPMVHVYDIPRVVTSVTRVTGLSHGGFIEFVAGRDYDAGLSRIIWRTSGSPGAADPPRSPDPRTPVEVTYRYRDVTSGISDVGPGSVAGTLLRTVARELALVYQQVNEAYRRAFLDTANGVALDGVVALLGVTRNPDQTASGVVRFSRRRSGPRVVVPAGTIVEDRAQRRYQTSGPVAFEQDALTADALVRAVRPGPEGNNDAGAVTVMPAPPAGVDAVTNPAAISGGLSAEADGALRERARHALERAGNGTMGALEFAVRDVDGVEDVAVIDHTVDVTVPLGEVRVRYSAGGDSQRRAEIQTTVDSVVQRTRAAGVLAVAEPVRELSIFGSVVVAGAADAGTAAAASYQRALTGAIDGGPIGHPLSLRKLVALVFQVPGLVDVVETRLRYSRPRPQAAPEEGAVGDLLPVGHSEHTVAGDIRVLLVDGLDAVAPVTVQGPLPVTVQLLNGGNPIAFTAARLQVRIEVRAGLLALPDQPPVVVADVTREVTFDHADAAVLTLTVGSGAGQDLRGYHPGEHNPRAQATVTLVGYGVPAATTTLVLG